MDRCLYIDPVFLGHCTVWPSSIDASDYTFGIFKIFMSSSSVI